MGYVNYRGEPLDDLSARVKLEAERRRRLNIIAPPNRKPTVKNGYSAPPGTGPEGETCSSCQHKHSMVNRGGSKRWIKCDLARARWTNGAGTDILARSPACRDWSAVPSSATPTAEPGPAATKAPAR